MYAIEPKACINILSTLDRQTRSPGLEIETSWERVAIDVKVMLYFCNHGFAS